MIFSRESNSEAVPQNTIRAEYERRLQELQTSLSPSQRQQSISLFALTAFVLLTILSAIEASHFPYPVLMVLPILGGTFALRAYLRSRARSLQLAIRSGFYERGLERLGDAWQTIERTGEEFARENHLYQSDLQILGKRSLFALLCTTRSQAGAARLASYLLDPVDLEEAKARQEAVKELFGTSMLREEIALLGKYQFQECDPETLHEWVGGPILNIHSGARGILLACGSVTLLLGLACFAGLLSWIQVVPIAAALVLTQTAVSLPLFREVRLRLKKLRTLTNEFSVLERGLELLQRQNFTSTKLKTLVRRVREDDASLCLLKLERLLWAIAQREKELLYLPSLLVAAGTQLALAIERWRATHDEHLKEWIDCWAEFEALNAVACYAYEHPADVFPELVSGTAAFEALGIGHPLLPAENCVHNDVALNESVRFYIVSGSNMAGKSTFLKAIGMNAVLAFAGAPVRATQARLTSLTICASNSIADSLLDGKSKFLAETERLRGALRHTSFSKPVLFLIDEILSGTNSHDRCIACESILKALTAGGAVGMLSTHDLALTEIADRPGLKGSNCHMESDHPSDPLNFDYKVKAGTSRRSNALAILETIGLHEGYEKAHL